MIVRLGFVNASLVRISSGFSPHARIISLRASILLRRVFGVMLRPDAAKAGRGRTTVYGNIDEDHIICRYHRIESNLH